MVSFWKWISVILNVEERITGITDIIFEPFQKQSYGGIMCQAQRFRNTTRLGNLDPCSNCDVQMTFIIFHLNILCWIYVYILPLINSNELFSITSTTAKKASPNEEDKTASTQCRPIFPGMKYCTIHNYYNTNSVHSPFYPLTGESR